jgi:hypothetical protein
VGDELVAGGGVSGERAACPPYPQLLSEILMMTADEPEEKVLEFLDHILQREPVRAFLDAVAARVEQWLRADPAEVMAWEPVPLDVYGTPLPGGIQSRWVFILRADVATGEERHPNSRQRMISYRGAGDLQTKQGERWESHRLDSDPHLPLQQRWISVPENVWHQAATPAANWVVVSFHTVSGEELVEERPALSGSGSTQQRKYLEMT